MSHKSHHNCLCQSTACETMHNLWGKHLGLVVPMSHVSLALLLLTILSSIWNRELLVKATCSEKSCTAVNRYMQSLPCTQYLVCTKCRMMELIEEACDPGIFGQQFFYSYGTDITLTQQRFTSLSESSSGEQKPQWARADKRFFWNRHLTQSLTDTCYCPVVELPAEVVSAF